MSESEKQFNKSESEIGERGMRLIEGHPICGSCFKSEHEHSIDKGDRHDCKNLDRIRGKELQCHCGFGGICRDQKWESWEEN